MKAPTMCPPGRSRPLPNNKKSAPGPDPGKKMLVFDERSRYMHENTRKDDTMTDAQSDICGNLESN